MLIWKASEVIPVISYVGSYYILQYFKEYDLIPPVIVEIEGGAETLSAATACVASELVVFIPLLTPYNSKNMIYGKSTLG